MTYPNISYQGPVPSGGYACTLQGISFGLAASLFRVVYFFWLRPLFVAKKHQTNL